MHIHGLHTINSSDSGDPIVFPSALRAGNIHGHEWIV